MDTNEKKNDSMGSDDFVVYLVIGSIVGVSLAVVGAASVISYIDNGATLSLVFSCLDSATGNFCEKD